MTLVGVDGSPRSSLTDERGRFAIAASGAGQYVLEVKRIGVKRVSTPLTQFAAGETREFTIGVAAVIALQTEVIITEQSRCALRAEDGSRAAAIWDDVRAALVATELSVAERRFSATFRDYTRDLDPASGRVLLEQRTERRGVTTNPYVSAPPSELSEKGYIVSEAGNVRRYRAPDASVLISDAFVRDHCFRLTDGLALAPGTIGLAFKPTPARRKSDVTGTLWLDRATHELQFLDFDYVNEPEPRSEDATPGGQVSFKRLPSGAWIVERWRIRVPILELAASPRSRLGREFEPARVRVAAIREVGGAVVAADVGLEARDSTAAIVGTAFDSTTDAPLADALIRMVGTSHEARSTADGRFRLSGVAPGRYVVTLTHDRLDSLGVAAPREETVVRYPGGATVTLAIPTWSSIETALCPGAVSDTTVGVLRGTVRNVQGRPQPDIAVEVSWLQFETVTGTTATLTSRPMRIVTRTDQAGHYQVCSVRADHPLQITAIDAAQMRARADARIPKRRVGVIDLVLAK
ncbi:MAG: carboxypeptidase-like regulatory domain-containing protein [Gemmatimonadota bacterium]|nr:carboxypeptidase-like regulatory domain-containing protein [Gemmatimonadota bacterium]